MIDKEWEELEAKDKKLESMIDEEWEELEAKVVSIVCISLAFEIKHNILNEYPSNL